MWKNKHELISKKKPDQTLNEADEDQLEHVNKLI